MNITAAQCRAARALLSLSQEALASSAGVGLSSVRDFETGRRIISEEMCMSLRSTLERAGVVFIAENGDGPGVRLKKGRR